MLHRLRCLVRLHKWQLAADELSDSQLRCNNCAKSKRAGKPRSASAIEDAGGYGNIH